MAPSKDLLDSWKIKYREIYKVSIGGKEYHFRALTLKEIEDIDLIGAEEGSGELEDFYVSTATLDPPGIDLDSIKPGYVSALANEIEAVSGLGEVNFIIHWLNTERQSAETDIIIMMKAFILAAIPNTSYEELDNMIVKDLIKRVIVAEKVLTIQQEVSGIQGAGVQFSITLQGEEEKEAPQSKQGKKAVNREELLRRINQNNKEQSDKKINLSEMETFDEDLLLKAAGVLKPEDPIARKLREATGGG